MFEDCSLWAPNALDWMLVGSRGFEGRPNDASFRAQWRDEVVVEDLRATAVGVPEMLGAMFLADAEQLARLVGDTAPLVDNFPKRLATRPPNVPKEWARYVEWMELDRARERFASSRWVRAHWPEALRRSTTRFFDFQRVWIEATEPPSVAFSLVGKISDLHKIIENGDLAPLAMVFAGSDPDHLPILAKAAPLELATPPAIRSRAIAALAQGRSQTAATLLGRAREIKPRDPRLLWFQMYALARSGSLDRAEAIWMESKRWLPHDEASLEYWRWLRSTFPRPNGGW